MNRLGDLARVVTDMGTLLITTVTDADDFDMDKLKRLNEPNDIFVINMGENNFGSFEVDVELEYRPEMDGAISQVIGQLKEENILLD